MQIDFAEGTFYILLCLL